MKQKHQGNLKERLQRDAETQLKIASALKTRSRVLERLQAAAENHASIESCHRNLKLEYKDHIVEFGPIRPIKSTDYGKNMLASAGHLFGIYKVPTFMNACWTIDINQKEPKPIELPRGVRLYRRAITAPPVKKINRDFIEFQREWYITQRSGGSLYKKKAKGYLSKAEVHSFLTCPVSANFVEAIIYAIASQHTKNLGVIQRVMKMKISEISNIFWTEDSLWREVILFFCRNELTLSKMNDLYDFFVVKKAESDTYSLKGRNLQSLERQMEDWHRELARTSRMGNSSWEGVPIENSSFKIDKIQWEMTQLTTSKALSKEGSAQHHCVYSYQARCINGSISVWSLTKFDEKSQLAQVRALTVEITSAGYVVQARGFGNRVAKPEEKAALKIWANRNGIKFVV